MAAVWWRNGRAAAADGLLGTGGRRTDGTARALQACPMPILVGQLERHWTDFPASLAPVADHDRSNATPYRVSCPRTLANQPRRNPATAAGCGQRLSARKTAHSSGARGEAQVHPTSVAHYPKVDLGRMPSGHYPGFGFGSTFVKAAAIQGWIGKVGSKDGFGPE